MARSLKITAYLGSGGGSTIERALREEKVGDLPFIRCGLVISSRHDAGLIERALAQGVSRENIVIIRRKDFPDEESFGRAILGECSRRGVGLVCQFGWLPKTPQIVLDAFPRRVINQHPGATDPYHATKAHPHPDFGGPRMHGRIAVAAGIRFAHLSGRLWSLEATTHHVTSTLDGGDIIARTQMPLIRGDTADSAQKRLLPIEHALQLSVLTEWGLHERLPEWRRAAPLIWDSELELLERAKRDAMAEALEEKLPS